LSSILSDNQARSPTFGSALNIPNRKVAVKTGTTNDSKDAWTVGYTPSLVIGVWMGNNENEPMVGLAGSSSAGGIWRTAMTSFMQNTPQEDFVRPSGVVALRVCTGSGLKAANSGSGTYEEVFVKGTEPKEECNKKTTPVQEEKKKPEDNKPEEQPQQIRQRQEEQTEQPQQPTNTGPGNNGTPQNPGNNGGGRGGEDPTTQPETPEPTTP
jgi:membrane carboxypeptidase/penicillin-binding protein